MADNDNDTTGGDGVTAISALVTWVIGGVLVVTLLIPILAGGGALWLAPAFAWGAAALYLLFDRRLARAERRDARLGTLWMVGLVAVFFAFYAIAVIASGHPEYLIPAVILAVIVTGYAWFNRWMTGKQLARHGGDTDAAMSDGDDPWPAAPHVLDESRPLGDTDQAHDEISPRDFPKGSPARQAAEHRAGAGR